MPFPLNLLVFRIRRRGRAWGRVRVECESHFSLYTILPLLILYGVWHTQGGVVEGSCIAH